MVKSKLNHSQQSQIRVHLKLRRPVSSTEEWDIVKTNHEVEIGGIILALSGHLFVIITRAVYLR